jgi:hypothetical protein
MSRRHAIKKIAGLCAGLMKVEFLSVEVFKRPRDLWESEVTPKVMDYPEQNTNPVYFFEAWNMEPVSIPGHEGHFNDNLIIT